MIEGITHADGGLAEVATDMAARFFPELAGDWQVGALAHQITGETVRLFADAWPIGRLDVVSLPGEEMLFAHVEDDFTATVQAHGVTANAGGVCLRSRRLILVCVRQFDLRGDWIPMLFIHEFAHTITPALPLHGPEWRACVQVKARQARRSGALALAALLDANAELYAVQERGGPDPKNIGAYLDAFFQQRDEDRRRVQITVEGGLTLAAWLDARQSTRRQAVSGSHSERRRE